MKRIKNYFNEFKTIASDMKFLLKPTWTYGKGYLISMIVLRAIIINPLITLIQVSSIRLIINAFSENKSFIEIISILLILEGISFLLGLLDTIYTEYYITKKSLEINSEIDKELFNKILHTDYRNFDDPNYYDSYTYTSQQYTSNAEEATNWLINLIQSIATITLLAVGMTTIDPIILCCILLALFSSTIISKKYNQLREETQKKHIPQNRIKYYVSRLFYLKEYAAEQKCTRLSKFSYEIYDKATNTQKKLINEYKEKYLKYRIEGSAVELLFNLSISIYLIYKVTSNVISLGDFAGVLAVANSLRKNIGIFFSSYTRAHNFSIYTKQIRKFFEKKSLIEDNTSKTEVSDTPFEVNFKNVNFSYDNSKFSIKNFNLRINKGEKIAFVGENGAGKTTITKLLTRLYDPSDGEIYINGKPLREYDTESIRLKIGIAFQDTHLYTMPYNKNLSLYHDLSDHELNEISKLLGLDKVLKKNNANYYSQVGREFDGSGILMSGGEIQKVGLARVLSGRFGLLILDEPTASLDPFAEHELNRIILNKAKTTTTILISHRLSTVRNADRIVFIDNGRIAEEGSHDELILKGGKYYEMFTKQAQNYRC